MGRWGVGLWCAGLSVLFEFKVLLLESISITSSSSSVGIPSTETLGSASASRGPWLSETFKYAPLALWIISGIRLRALTRVPFVIMGR